MLWGTTRSLGTWAQRLTLPQIPGISLGDPLLSEPQFFQDSRALGSRKYPGPPESVNGCREVRDVSHHLLGAACGDTGAQSRGIWGDKPLKPLWPAPDSKGLSDRPSGGCQRTKVPLYSESGLLFMQGKVGGQQVKDLGGKGGPVRSFLLNSCYRWAY